MWPADTQQAHSIGGAREIRKKYFSIFRYVNEFVLPRLQEWKSGYQAQVLRDFCKGIGVTQVRFHDLRATFITRLLNQGVPVAVVMALVGHAQLKTTQAYLRLSGIELKGATDKLGFDLPSTEGGKVLNLMGTKT